MVNEDEDLEIWEEGDYEDLDEPAPGPGAVAIQSNNAGDALAELVTTQTDMYSFHLYVSRDRVGGGSESASVDYFMGMWQFYPWKPWTERTGTGITAYDPSGQITKFNSKDDALAYLFQGEVNFWSVDSKVRFEGEDYMLNVDWHQGTFYSKGGWHHIKTWWENALAEGKTDPETFLDVAASYDWTFDQKALPQGLPPEDAKKYEASQAKAIRAKSYPGLIILVGVAAVFLMN